MYITIIRFFFAIFLGVLIGLENEFSYFSKRKNSKIKNKESAARELKSGLRIGSLRTFTLVAIIGGIGGLFAKSGDKIIPYILLLAVSVLVAISYIYQLKQKKSFGVTTEFSILVLFLLSYLITSEAVQLGVVLIIFLSLLFFYSRRGNLKNLIDELEEKEIVNTLIFAVFALAVLPLLSDKNYYFKDVIEWLNLSDKWSFSEDIRQIIVINPFTVWKTLVFVISFGLIGDFLVKYFKKRDTIVQGIFNGLVVVDNGINLGSKKESQKEFLEDSKASSYTSGILIAFGVNMLLITALSFLIGRDFLFKYIGPFFAMVGGFCILIGLIFKPKIRDDKKIKGSFKKRFSFNKVIIFVGFWVLLKFLIQILNIYDLGQISLIVLGLASLLGFVLPVLTVIDLNNLYVLTPEFSVVAVVITSVVTFLIRILSFLPIQNKPIWKKYTIAMLFTLFIGLLVLGIRVW